MNYNERKHIINTTNDGNHINQPPEDTNDIIFRKHCGFCGEPQEDNEAQACNTCLNDQFVKDYINGK